MTHALGAPGLLASTDAAVNLPNALTLASLGLGAWWAAGGPDWAAIGSIVLDEADGRVARATGQTTKFGSTFDWATDMVLTGLALRRVQAPWQVIPVVTTGQVVLREAGYSPPILSARALVMIYGVLTGEGSP